MAWWGERELPTRQTEFFFVFFLEEEEDRRVAETARSDRGSSFRVCEASLECWSWGGPRQFREEGESFVVESESSHLGNGGSVARDGARDDRGRPGSVKAAVPDEVGGAVGRLADSLCYRLEL